LTILATARHGGSFDSNLPLLVTDYYVIIMFLIYYYVYSALLCCICRQPQQGMKEALTPILHCLSQICRANRSIRKFCRIRVSGCFFLYNILDSCYWLLKWVAFMLNWLVITYLSGWVM